MILLPVFVILNVWGLFFTVPGVVNPRQSSLQRAQGAFCAACLAQCLDNILVELPAALNLNRSDSKDPEDLDERPEGQALQPYGPTGVSVYLRYEFTLDESPVCWNWYTGEAKPLVSFNPLDIFVLAAIPVLACWPRAPSVVSRLNRSRLPVRTPRGVPTPVTGPLVWIEKQAVVDTCPDPLSDIGHIHDQATTGTESAEASLTTPADSRSGTGPSSPPHLTRRRPDSTQAVQEKTATPRATAGTKDDSHSRAGPSSPHLTRRRPDSTQMVMGRTVAPGTKPRTDPPPLCHLTRRRPDFKQVVGEKTAATGTKDNSQTGAGPSSPLLTRRRPDSTQVVMEKTTAAGTMNDSGSRDSLSSLQTRQRPDYKQVDMKKTAPTEPKSSGPQIRPDQQEKLRAWNQFAADAAETAQPPRTGADESIQGPSAASGSAQEPQPRADAQGQGTLEAAELARSPEPEASSSGSDRKRPSKKKRERSRRLLGLGSSPVLHPAADGPSQEPDKAVKHAQTSKTEVAGPIQGPPEATKSVQVPEAGPSSPHLTGQRPDDKQVGIEKTAAAGGEDKSTGGRRCRPNQKRRRRAAKLAGALQPKAGPTESSDDAAGWRGVEGPRSVTPIPGETRTEAPVAW